MELIFPLNEKNLNHYGRDTLLVPKDGGVIANSKLLLCSETGSMSMAKNEEIGTYAWAKKTLFNPIRQSRESGMLMLLCYEYPGNAEPLNIALNGTEFQVLPNRQFQGAFKWREVPIPKGNIKSGENEIIISSCNTRFGNWILAIDGRSRGGTSWKSFDQGRTWLAHPLGYDYSKSGEYIVRLLVDSPPPAFSIESPILEFQEEVTVDELSCIDANGHLVQADFSIRFGDKPKAGRWVPFSLGKDLPSSRFWQWKLQVSTEPAKPITEVRVQISTCDQLSSIRVLPSYLHVFETPAHPRLVNLRVEENLEKVAGPGSDWEKAKKLMTWTAQQWKWHESRTAYTPWDGGTILDWMRRDRGHTYQTPVGFCVHFAVLYCQALCSMNILARPIILGKPVGVIFGGGHFCAEVWSPSHKKWIMMDPTHDIYLAHAGIPLSVLEIGDIVAEGKAKELQIMEGPASDLQGERRKRFFERLEGGGYRVFGLPLRSDYLSRPDTQFVEHGWHSYSETEVVWWNGDYEYCKRFPLLTNRQEDLYWEGSTITTLLPVSTLKGFVEFRR